MGMGGLIMPGGRPRALAHYARWRGCDHVLYGLGLGSWLVLIGYLWQHSRDSLLQISIFYVVVIVAELIFSKRALVRLHRDVA